MTWKDAETRRAYVRARDKAIREGTWQPRQVVSEKIPCAHCGELFRRAPSNRLHRGKNNYCSRTCMATAYVGRESPKRGPVESRPCANCGQSITRPVWMWVNDLAFCDRACFGAWKSSNWTADSNPAWQGGFGPRYYGANWKRQQREARRRDGHCCQFCGVAEAKLRRALDVHHIRPFRFFGVENYREANRLANLISLCDRCHTYLERFCHDGSITRWPELQSRGLEFPGGQELARPAMDSMTQVPANF